MRLFQKEGGSGARNFSPVFDERRLDREAMRNLCGLNTDDSARTRLENIYLKWSRLTRRQARTLLAERRRNLYLEPTLAAAATERKKDDHLVKAEVKRLALIVLSIERKILRRVTVEAAGVHLSLHL